MRIVLEALSYRIGQVTNGYFIRARPGFPESFSVFDPYIDQMAAAARERGHFEILKPGIEYLVTHPEVDLESYGSDENWVWSHDEVRALLIYIRNRLWPDAGPLPEGGPPGVELVPAPGLEWGLLDPAVRPDD